MGKISAQEIKKLWDEKEDFLLLDVREQASFLQSHIQGAKSVPLDDLESEMGKFDKSKLIVVYCKGPRCPLSGFAEEKLAKAGFTVKHYEGGMEEWKALGFPVEE